VFRLLASVSRTPHTSRVSSFSTFFIDPQLPIFYAPVAAIHPSSVDISCIPPFVDSLRLHSAAENSVSLPPTSFSSRSPRSPPFCSFQAFFFLRPLCLSSGSASGTATVLITSRSPGDEDGGFVPPSSFLFFFSSLSSSPMPPVSLF